MSESVLHAKPRTQPTGKKSSFQEAEVKRKTLFQHQQYAFIRCGSVMYKTVNHQSTIRNADIRLSVRFYSASALLAMQSAVLARGILSVRMSVRLSVRLSVTFRYCVQTNEDTIVRFSASDRTIPLVSER